MKVILELLERERQKSLRTVERFPCVIGRSSSTDLRLEEPGIWDQHLRLDLRPARGVTVSVLSNALATVNSRPVTGEPIVLRNGDIIDAGAVKLRFWLAPTRQRSYRLRETMTWLALGLICAGQAWLLWRVLP